MDVGGFLRTSRQRLPSGSADKSTAKLDFGRGRFTEENGVLGNEHFEVLFAEHFGVHRSFFAGKRILDIGCGPRGSLEWASDTSRRVGSDPLVDAYSEFGIDLHAI